MRSSARARGWVIACVASALLSCAEPPRPSVESAAATTSSNSPVVAQEPLLHGFVTYPGQVAVVSFPRGEDVACAPHLPDPVQVSSVERTGENRVAGALVMAKSALTVTASGEPRELRISGCRFSSSVVPLETSQRLRIVNDDDALHSLVAEIEGQTVLDAGLPFAGMAAEVSLPASELAIRVRCRRHPWMSAAVVRAGRQPWAVTDEDGRFALSGLAAGPQEFSVWHPWLGGLEVAATVDLAASAPLELQYPVAGQVSHEGAVQR